MTKITLWNVIGWIFGCIFALGGIGMLVSGAIFAAIIYFIIACIMIPPVMTSIEKKTDIELSGGIKIVLIVILCIILVPLMPDASTSQEVNNKDVPSRYIDASSGSLQNVPDSIQTSVPVQWHEIARWDGTGTKNTETFTIPGGAKEWRISWDTRPNPDYGMDMNFIITIYKSSGSMKGIAANVIGIDTDSTIMRGSGDYYLEILSGQLYDIVVEAKY